MTTPEHPTETAEPSTREKYLAKREGWLTVLSVAGLAALVLSFAGLMRAGHGGTTFGGILPADLADAGGAVYSAKCSSCHGGTGGGGVGPQLSAGEVVKTYPDPVNHLRWVILGSEGGADLYTAAGKTSKGGMPAWGPTLTLSELVHVVLYERQEVSGQPLAGAEAQAWTDGLPAIVDEFPDLNLSQDDVQALIDEINAAAGG